LSPELQMKQMAYCMAQDCEQSLEAVSCRYTAPSGLCYTNPGQGWCAENAYNSDCLDRGAESTAANLDGPGAWVPLSSVKMFGQSQIPGVKEPETGQLTLQVMGFTPAEFYCDSTGGKVTSCEECAEGCLSPQKALDNRQTDTGNSLWWNPIGHVVNADDISLSVDAGGVKTVRSVLWANMGDTTHDPAYLKIDTADTPDGPWTMVADMDLKSLQGKKAVNALPLPTPATARYFRLSPGGITHQSIIRAIGLCTSANCQPPPAAPAITAADSVADGSYSCTCFKNCAHFTGKNVLKKYRCTGGNAIKVGTIEGTPAATAEIKSSSKTGQCACSCGIAGTDQWYAQDAQ